MDNAKINNFHAICSRLKSYKTISTSFKNDIKLFYKTAL